MVKVMPNSDSILRRLRTPRVGAFSASVLLLLSGAVNSQAAILQSEADDSSSFWTFGIPALLIAVLVGLLVYKVRKSRNAAKDQVPAPVQPQELFERRQSPAPARAAELPAGKDRRAPGSEATPAAEKAAQAEKSAFGAYRIDQEVSKLVVGKPHRTDVLSSRTPEDRRAIEASLMKALESSETDEDARERIREALEEYGFVARQSAIMLMGRDAWERSSAARVLGQIGAKSSLPFFIEALHDTDSVVRNQAVTSLGSLKAPAAIGALLDIARRHPDIPPSLLSETLSACSVDSLSFLDTPSAEANSLSADNGSSDMGDLDRLGTYQALPSATEDNKLDELLAELESPEESTRAVAAQQLSLHPVSESVDALTKLVMDDSEPSVRAAAVASLGSIDHESVFAPVLVALADESRIVRAAAARTLTSLHFDRAEAYVRVTESADVEMLQKVAKACVETGIAAQTVDRLVSEDRRQAYEAFSLFSLLARAREIEPILDVIRKHKDEEVRLCAIRVLSLSPDASLAPQLRDIVGSNGVPENVRTAVLELLYKIDQPAVPGEFDPSDIQPVTLHNSSL
jgi:HEAT repeat protein